MPDLDAKKDMKMMNESGVKGNGTLQTKDIQTGSEKTLVNTEEDEDYGHNKPSSNPEAETDRTEISDGTEECEKAEEEAGTKMRGLHKRDRREEWRRATQDRGFTPFSASLLFGLSLVAILVKHPELYPCWLRPVNVKLMFIYELFVSLIFIEIGFCLWNSVETFLFYRIPSFLEEHCTTFGDYYIYIVESPVGVSIISNLLSLFLLLITLHTTRVCNFNLLLKSNGIHKFFADAGLTSRICRHHKEARQTRGGSDTSLPPPSCGPPTMTNRSIHPTYSRSPGNSGSCSHGPKMLRSGKKIY